MNVFLIFSEALIVLTVSCGLVLHSGITKGAPRKDMFRYYTNLSNLLLGLYFLARFVIRVRGSYAGPIGKFVFSECVFYCVTMMIYLTHAIFAFVLTPYFMKHPENGDGQALVHSFSSILVHYVSPLLALLTWILFADKTKLRYAWAFIWTIIPLLYLAYSFIRGADGKNLYKTDSPYPYNFMDPKALGWKRVFLNIVVIYIIFVLVGALMIFIRRLI